MSPCLARCLNLAFFDIVLFLMMSPCPVRFLDLVLFDFVLFLPMFPIPVRCLDRVLFDNVSFLSMLPLPGLIKTMFRFACLLVSWNRRNPRPVTFRRLQAPQDLWCI